MTAMKAIDFLGSIGCLFWKTESHYNEESCQAFCGYWCSASLIASCMCGVKNLVLQESCEEHALQWV
jgi:hypothetical protein